MNYYNEYIDYNEDDISLYELNKKDDNFYVNDIEIENNRGINGDLAVIKDNKIINIKKRSNQKIVNNQGPSSCPQPAVNQRRFLALRR